MSTGSDLITLIASRQNLDDYQKKHWTGSFAEYLDIVQRDPKVTRTAYQRIYDMIISHGTEEVVVNKEKMIRYKFFEDPENEGQDAIFGLERTLINFVNILEERCQRLWNGAASLASARAGRQLQEHAGTAAEKGAGTVFASRRGRPLQLRWKEEGPDGEEIFAVCPMHEEPLHLIPQEHRAEVTALLNKGRGPRRLPGHDRRRPLPILPPDVQRADGTIRGRLGARRARTSACAG